MPAIYKELRSCRVCQSPELAEVMDFGQQYLASVFVRNNGDHPLARIKVPLTVVLCNSCKLLQLGQTVERDLLFTAYHYRSHTNPMMRQQLKDVVVDTMKKAPLRSGDYVLDVGCNDCTMLSYFPQQYHRIGIDPAGNIDWSNLDPSITAINGYFCKETALGASRGASYRVVNSIAMLYSVEDLNQFATQVKSILAPDGVWCVQVSYLPATLQSLSFYDVCHEHLYYFCLATLEALMRRNGLKIVAASLNEVNGGSLRVFATHEENHNVSKPDHCALAEEEAKLKLAEQDTYRSFFDKVCALKGKVRAYIQKERENGNRVIGLGASTKGNVLLQFFGIDKELLPYISERNPEKVSLRTLGTDIELISEERARELNPSCMLVLIWFFRQEIIQREHPYLQAGGKLLFPMPYCHLVSKDGERRL